MKEEYEKIIKVINNLTEKQKFSEELDVLIKEITESTDTDGNIQLQLLRTNRTITYPAQMFINQITSKKDVVDTQIATLISKIKINGK